jgi:hypothetical protein
VEAKTGAVGAIVVVMPPTYTILQETEMRANHTLSNAFGVRFGVRDMKLLKQSFVMKPP